MALSIPRAGIPVVVLGRVSLSRTLLPATEPCPWEADFMPVVTATVAIAATACWAHALARRAVSTASRRVAASRSRLSLAHSKSSARSREQVSLSCAWTDKNGIHAGNRREYTYDFCCLPPLIEYKSSDPVGLCKHVGILVGRCLCLLQLVHELLPRECVNHGRRAWSRVVTFHGRSL